MTRRGKAARPGGVLLAGCLLLAGGVLAGCGHARPAAAPPTRAAAPSTSAAGPAPAPLSPFAGGPPPPARSAEVRGAQVAVHTTPGGPVQLSLANPNSFGAPLVLLVVGEQAGWYQVSLPVRPNGSTGWVSAADVAVRELPYQLTVQLHSHTVTLWQDGKALRAFPTAIGSPGAPSPTGLFYVNVVIDNRAGSPAYGPWALGLTGYSDVYQHFSGGNGQIAIHGTNEDASVGQPMTHGCLRLHNPDISTLAGMVTLGTPVYVGA